MSTRNISGLTNVSKAMHFTCFLTLHYILSRFTAQIAIHNGDGSVQVILGAIEMGQGLNTKVAQVRNEK